MLVNTIFEEALDQILDVATRFSSAAARAGIPCRVVGGLAVYLHVESPDPLAARLTRDVDVAVDRTLLAELKTALAREGFLYRHTAGVDMFFESESDRARSVVHVVFVGERVRPEYVEPIPNSPAVSRRGLLVAPVSDLIVMKLTSFRLKDKVHIQDMDSVGLITPGIEAGLSSVLRARLAEVRAAE